MNVKRLYVLTVVLWLAYLCAFLPAARRPAAAAAPILAEVLPAPWIGRWIPEPIARLDRFVRQFPAGRNPAVRREIVLKTWINSRIIWEHPRTRPLFSRPEEPAYLLVSQQAAESGCNPAAVSPRNPDGSRDLGLTQQNSRYLHRRGITDWRDISQQTRAQARFMCSLLQQSSRYGGDRALRAAIAGYTAGPVWTSRGVVPDIGRTRVHTAKIMRYYRSLRGPAMPAPGPRRTGGRVYIVQRGDTLSRIAARFGTHYQDIAAINGIANPDLIITGQRLVIP